MADGETEPKSKSLVLFEPAEPDLVPLNAYDPTSSPNADAGSSKSRKSGLKLVYSECLRRSPRFSPAAAAVRLGKKRVRERLSYVSSIPRSPRFTLDKSKGCMGEIITLKEYEREESMHLKFMRESPRLSSGLLSSNDCSSEPALLIVSPIISECPLKGSSVPVPLRSFGQKLGSSREMEDKQLILTWNEDDKSCHELKARGGKKLRRSPRFTSSTENGVTDRSLRKSTISQSDGKEQSPRTFSKLDKGGNGSHAFSVLHDTPDERPSKRFKNLSENSDLENLDDIFCKQSQGSISSSIDSENEKMMSIGQHSRENVKQSIRGKKQKKNKSISSLVGDPIPNDEAQERWCWRYEMKNERSKNPRQKLEDDDHDEDKIVWNVECHYTQAEIAGCIFNLGDCAYIKGEGEQKHVGRILEFFRTTDGGDYFRVQWFYRAEDTVMKGEAEFHDKKRLFYSTVMNDNPIDCIISKVNVVLVSPMINLKSNSLRLREFYCDMEYCVDYSTFRTLPTGNSFNGNNSSSPAANNAVCTRAINNLVQNMPSCDNYKAELALLDIFSGCGGMSTGLCLGSKASCIDLVTRWALDCDKSACDSLKFNHPEAHVRNEAAEDFLELLKEWQKLCKIYMAKDVKGSYDSRLRNTRSSKETKDSSNEPDTEELEVSSIIDICYGDPDETGKRGLKLKVHWKGYDTSEDTWEPIEGLSNCRECIGAFVRDGFKSRILPLPGDVDVICGGPPCQGISGYNRYRNVDSPLADERNRQIIVFMDIVKFLKPKFVLMENVVDILRFDKASLARYALSRLVGMKYQARLGTIAAGCYGLPQFRLRVFLWGAHPSEKLPQFPLPTHDVIVRYWPPPEFERNTVAYDEDQPRELEKAIVLQDAISDLPDVTSHEVREEITYTKPPETEFQKFIRAAEYEMSGSKLRGTKRTRNVLYDHRPYSVTEEDYARLCQIPKRKGANFRDLPGVVVGSDNIARPDPKEQILLPSGKPLVPGFAFTFEQGKSKRPYARLWWDETVPTIVTYPDLHSQAVIHPEQDRVLTVRECARLQGFPDYYRFCGRVKERYRQIGNAVAVPVGRALGFALGMAFQKLSGDEPLMKLPPKFSHSTNLQLAESFCGKDD